MCLKHPNLDGIDLMIFLNIVENLNLRFRKTRQDFELKKNHELTIPIIKKRRFFYSITLGFGEFIL